MDTDTIYRHLSKESLNEKLQKFKTTSKLFHKSFSNNILCCSFFPMLFFISVVLSTGFFSQPAPTNCAPPAEGRFGLTMTGGLLGTGETPRNTKRRWKCRACNGVGNPGAFYPQVIHSSDYIIYISIINFVYLKKL